MSSLVLVRHGESVWNRARIFTGWTDIDLNELGIEEARATGRWLASEGFCFDVCHTSYLKRAIRTLWLILEEMDRMWLPVQTTWRLNERHYGRLQGISKEEMSQKYGAEQVFKWRRSFDARPPSLDRSDPRFFSHDPRYSGVSAGDLPTTESLADTIQRVLPYWHEVIAPQLQQGLDVLVSGHGNSLRGLMKYLDNISDTEIAKLRIATGAPSIYRFDERLRIIERRPALLPPDP